MVISIWVLVFSIGSVIFFLIKGDAGVVLGLSIYCVLLFNLMTTYEKSKWNDSLTGDLLKKNLSKILWEISASIFFSIILTVLVSGNRAHFISEDDYTPVRLSSGGDWLLLVIWSFIPWIIFLLVKAFLLIKSKIRSAIYKRKWS